MAADNFTREIELDDSTLFGFVEEKGKLVNQGRELSKQLEALHKQLDELTTKMQLKTEQVNEVKRKIINRCQKRAGALLTEFEIPVTTEIRNGKLYLVITDTLEEFKGTFKTFDKWHEPVPRKKKEISK